MKSTRAGLRFRSASPTWAIAPSRYVGLCCACALTRVLSVWVQLLLLLMYVRGCGCPRLSFACCVPYYLHPALSSGSGFVVVCCSVVEYSGVCACVGPCAALCYIWWVSMKPSHPAGKADAADGGRRGNLVIIFGVCIMCKGGLQRVDMPCPARFLSSPRVRVTAVSPTLLGWRARANIRAVAGALIEAG